MRLFGEKARFPPWPTVTVAMPEVADAVVVAATDEEEVESLPESESPYCAKTTGRAASKSAEVYMLIRLGG